MADNVKITLDLTANPAAARQLQAAFAQLERKGKGAADGISGSFARLRSKLSGLGGLLGGLTLGVAFKAVLDNTAESEQALRQLEAGLKSTRGIAGVTAGEIEKVADALQQTTTTGDDAIVKMASVIATFTNIRGAVFKDALPAILDLSTRLGVDLNSAAIQVGKALNDPIQGITALSRAGVQFSPQQKALIAGFIKTGEVAKAQRVILDELSAQMGGSAAAAADTLSGAIEQAKNAFGNLLEGDSDKGGVKEAKTAIQDLTKTLNDPGVKEGFAAIVSGLGQVAAYAANAIAQTHNFSKAIRDALATDDKKSYDGLLTKRLHLVDDLEAVQKGKLAALKQLYLGRGIGDVGEDNIRLFEGNEAAKKRLAQELAQINSLLAQRRGSISAPKIEWIDPPAPTPKDPDNPTGADFTVTPPGAKKSQAAKNEADDLAKSLAALTDIVEGLRAETGGPAAEAWEQYRQTVMKTAEAGAAAIKAGGDEVTVQQRVSEAITFAAQQRDAALAKANESTDEWLLKLQDLQAEVGGPLAGVMLEFERNIQAISKALDKGAINPDTFQKMAEAYIVLRDKAVEAIEKPIGKLGEFMKSAAQNIQSSLADSLFNFADEGFKGLLRNAVDTFKRIASEALAAQIASKLFGDLDKTGQTGGWLGSLMGLFSGKTTTTPAGSNASSGSGLGSLLSLFTSLFGSAKGNVFNSGQIKPFARGGLMQGPLVFPMAQGKFGMMAEEAPKRGLEAIMPLARDSRGYLGVRGVGGRGGSPAGDASRQAIRLIVVDDRAKINDFRSAPGERVLVQTLTKLGYQPARGG